MRKPLYHKLFHCGFSNKRIVICLFGDVDHRKFFLMWTVNFPSNGISFNKLFLQDFEMIKIYLYISPTCCSMNEYTYTVLADKFCICFVLLMEL